MNKFEELKEQVRYMDRVIIRSEKEDRPHRIVFASLAKEDVFFIPVETPYFREYVNANYLEPSVVEKYARQEIKRCKSQFFNRVKPLQRYIKDEKLSRQMGKLELVWDEE